MRDDERSGHGAFAGVIAELIGSCGAQADELGKWPFDVIAQIVRPDDAQRGALDELRTSAAATADKLNADCPRRSPAPLAERLDELEHGINTALAALDAVRPALAAFYGALDDEQKARLLLRVPGAPAPEAQQVLAQVRLSRRESRRQEGREDKRERRGANGGRASPPRSAGVPCEELAAALRDWPIRRIERDAGLGDVQRVALYEMVTISLKAADALACPAESALTPLGRLDIMRARLAAVRMAVGAIRPGLMRFYEALDQGQQQRFAQM